MANKSYEGIGITGLCQVLQVHREVRRHVQHGLVMLLTGWGVVAGCRSRGEKGKAGGSEVQARVSSKVMENIRDLPAVLMMDED